MGWSGNKRLNARNKYGAKKTAVDGITFDSQKEARRYGELRLLEKAGEITDLELQPEYELRAEALFADTPRSDLIIGTYVADFWYIDKETGKGVVEDVKGFKTPLYRWKKKHVEAQYGIEIKEV